jgi:hypothetical protein
VSNVIDIRMQSDVVDCWICGAATEHRWGVPTCNGDLVSNSFPDHLWDGGQAVCEKCFEKHAQGHLATMDHVYVPRWGFVHGEGI